MKTELIDLLRQAFQLGQQWVHDINNGDEPENFNSWVEKQSLTEQESKVSEIESIENDAYVKGYERAIFDFKQTYAQQNRDVEYELTFGNHLKAKIKITNDKIEVLGAMNGWGDNVPQDEIKVEQFLNREEANNGKFKN